MPAARRRWRKRWLGINYRQKAFTGAALTCCRRLSKPSPKEISTLRSINSPYLHGFYTVMVLFLYKISGGLIGPSDINTGLNFLTKANADPSCTVKAVTKETPVPYQKNYRRLILERKSLLKTCDDLQRTHRTSTLANGAT